MVCFVKTSFNDLWGINLYRPLASMRMLNVADWQRIKFPQTYRHIRPLNIRPAEIFIFFGNGLAVQRTAVTVPSVFAVVARSLRS